MLNKFRGRNAKKILWMLLCIIVPAFALWGARSLTDRKKNIIGTIDNRKITIAELNNYARMAQVHAVLYSPKKDRIKRREAEDLGLNFLLLIWKAEQEKITVNDQEVIAYIIESFFSQEKFDKTQYENILGAISQRYNLGITSRSFEEYIRNFIKINKLFDNHIKVAIDDEEVKGLYKKDTQKAKITYLFIPYEKFKLNHEVAQSEIEEFYQKNKSLFMEKIGEGATSAPALEKVKEEVEKKLIESKAKEETKKFSKKLLEKINKQEIKDLEKIAGEEDIKFKETGEFKYSDPIEGLGLNKKISEIVFSLKNKEIYPEPVALIDGVYIIQAENITPFDDEAFQKEKQAYFDRIAQFKESIERMKFLAQLHKEANLKFLP